MGWNAMKTRNPVILRELVWSVLVMMVCTSTACLAEDLDPGVAVLTGSRPSSPHGVIAGIDLSMYGYLTITQYVFLEEHLLLVLGEKEEISPTGKESVPCFSAIVLPSGHEIVIQRYEQDLSWFFGQRSTMMTVLQYTNLPTHPIFVLLDYRSGNINQTSEYTHRVFDLFRIETDSAVLLRQQELTKAVHLDYDNRLPGQIYRQSEWTVSQKNPDVLEAERPVSTELVSYVFPDVNNDGFADILFWKGIYVSRKITDPGADDFALNREQVLVMYFEPETMTFTEMSPFDADQAARLEEFLN